MDYFWKNCENKARFQLDSSFRQLHELARQSAKKLLKDKLEMLVETLFRYPTILSFLSSRILASAVALKGSCLARANLIPGIYKLSASFSCSVVVAGPTYTCKTGTDSQDLNKQIFSSFETMYSWNSDFLLSSSQMLDSDAVFQVLKLTSPF